MLKNDKSGSSLSQITPPIDDRSQYSPQTNSKAQPQVQKITLVSGEQTAHRPVEAKPLGQRETQLAKPPPILLQQARHAALPSWATVARSPGILNSTVSAHSLPSTSQFIASLSPAKSDTLLERLLSFLGLYTPSPDYQNILTALSAYHNACRAGAGVENGEEAMAQLSKLGTMVGKYSTQGNENTVSVINDMGKEIINESAMLRDLTAELQDTVLPEGISLSHALAFKREGVPLEQMVVLHAKGLKLVQPPEAQHILKGEKPAAAPHKNPATALNSEPSGILKILADLEQYHSIYTAKPINAEERSDLRAAKQAKEVLDQLSTNAQAYLEKNNQNPQPQAIEILRDQIVIERRVLQGVITELDSGKTLPEKADLSHALAFAREGVSLRDMTRLMEKGLQPYQAADARIALDSEIALSVINNLANLTPEKKAETTQEFNEQELLLLTLSGLGTEGGREYKRLGIPITRQTVAVERTDAQRVDNRTMPLLHNRRSNKLYTARYIGPNNQINGVFKPLQNTENRWVAKNIGIDPNYPKIANRNLATQDVARALGFDVVVDTQIGSRLDPQTRKLEIGLVMGRALGITASNTPAVAFRNPEVRREITKLQLLDHLVGQGDRHPENYFIHGYRSVDGSIKAKVTGIDNSQCFGPFTTNGNGISYSSGDGLRDGFRGTKMPQLIDTDMATAIHRITPDLLSSILSDKLSEAEVGAAHERLSSLQDHVHSLEKQGQVLTPEQWNENAATTADQSSDNSYVFRDADKQFGW